MAEDQVLFICNFKIHISSHNFLQVVAIQAHLGYLL